MQNKTQQIIQSQKQILIDLLKLNNLYVGLGQVSLHYGKAISAKALELKDEMEFTFLVPENFVGYFGDAVKYQTPIFFKRHFSFLNTGFDLWHSIHQDSDFMPSSKSQFVLTIHDLNFLTEKNQTKAKKRLAVLQQKVNRANAVVSISNFSKSEIERHLQLKNKKVEVIYNGVESLLHSASVKPSFLKNENQFLFTIGNLTAKKNFHVLLPMMKLLPQFQLIIAGNDADNYATEMKKKITDENISNVIITGKIAAEEKNYLMQNCTAFLFPSLLEGFGLPVVEAMSCGKAVFVSRLTSLPEIAADKGFYLDNFESQQMANLIQEKLQWLNLHQNFNQEIIAHANKFQWEMNAAKYLELYRSQLR